MVPVDLLNYQLIRLLGRGGMGEVYLARNKNIDQFVAVKALHPKYANSPVLRSRFKQEAVMLNSLNHPNIVKFLNFVENEYGVFLIMEYVDGYTLEEYRSLIEDRLQQFFRPRAVVDVNVGEVVPVKEIALHNVDGDNIKLFLRSVRHHLHDDDRKSPIVAIGISDEVEVVGVGLL